MNPSKIFLILIFLYYQNPSITIAQTKRSCQPISVSFKHFQKNNLNILIGLESGRTRIEKKDYRIYSGSVGINYFPIKYLEIGAKFKPTLAKYDVVGSTYLTEYNCYFRYYSAFIPCYNVGLFTGSNLVFDKSKYSFRGEPKNTNEIDPALTVGLAVLFWKQLRLEANPDFFLNSRATRYNLSLLHDVKNFSKN